MTLYRLSLKPYHILPFWIDWSRNQISALSINTGIFLTSLDEGNVLDLSGAFADFGTIGIKGPQQVIDTSSILTDNWKIIQEDGNYELNPALYVSTPQLSWPANLKHTKYKIELITDPEIYRSVTNSMLFGISMIIGWQSNANNEYMSALFDTTKPRIKSVNVDVNNLYEKVF